MNLFSGNPMLINPLEPSFDRYHQVTPYGRQQDRVYFFPNEEEIEVLDIAEVSVSVEGMTHIAFRDNHSMMIVNKGWLAVLVTDTPADDEDF